jgi:hypothetical protein
VLFFILFGIFTNFMFITSLVSGRHALDGSNVIEPAGLKGVPREANEGG